MGSLAHPAWSSVLTGTTYQQYIEFHLKSRWVFARSRRLFQRPVTTHNPSRVMACLTEVTSSVERWAQRWSFGSAVTIRSRTEHPPRLPHNPLAPSSRVLPLCPLDGRGDVHASLATHCLLWLVVITCLPLHDLSLFCNCQAPRESRLTAAM